MLITDKPNDLDIKIGLVGALSWCAVLLIGAIYCIYKAMS